MGNAEQASGLMTLQEGASFLRLKTATLRAWRQQRRIAVVKLGRKVFVRRADLENLIANSVVPAALSRGNEG
jgi:excisionase family DNA binding protein